MTNFAVKLAQGFASGKRLSVGIDAHDAILKEWGLSVDAKGAEAFGRTIVEAAHANALVVKPQIAFFERFGAAGYQALERIIADARQADVSVIADVKRGDIGSTFAAYAEAWLTPGAPLEVDAMTAHAYHGFDSLSAGFELAQKHQKIIFVLAATSNPEAAGLQQAVMGSGETVAAGMVAAAQSLNAANPQGVAVAGVVIGATLNLSDFKIADVASAAELQPLPVLAPGFGFQGAGFDDLQTRFGGLSAGLIVHESRSLLAGGATGLQDRIAASAAIVRGVF